MSEAGRLVYLGLGANLGDRWAKLRAAVVGLAPFLGLVRASSVYETAPMHLEDQPRFLNLVCEGVTELEPLALLRALKDLERALGRKPGVRYGPRAIDLDILLYADLILHTPELTIPHPRLTERAFVLIPLAEIAPQMRHPELQRVIEDLVSALPSADVRRLGTL